MTADYEGQRFDPAAGQPGIREWHWRPSRSLHKRIVSVLAQLWRFKAVSSAVPRTGNWRVYFHNQGRGWLTPAGWAVVAIDRMSGARDLMAGGCSHATVAWAELEPYLQAIRRDFNVRQGGKLDSPRRVVIFTDNQSTARIGRGEYAPKANMDLWMCVEYWKAKGYELRWHWVERNCNGLHVLVDRISRSGDIYADLAATDEAYSLLPD